MNYDRKSKKLSTFVKIVLVLAIIVLLIDLFLPKVFSSVFTRLTVPFWNLERTVEYDGYFVSVKSLIEENRNLKATIAKNDLIYKEANLLKDDNAELKKIVDNKGVHLATRVIADVIKKPPFSIYDTYIVASGKDAGVLVGDIVYALENVPIGKIEEVNGNTSKVKLFSSPGEKYDVFVGKNKLEAQAIGRGGGTFEVSMPRDVAVAEGDYVTVPDLPGSFLGIVRKIDSIPSNPFSTVLFSQPVNIYELDRVEIAHKNDI